jgi:sphingomyelin phosphodiesterase acid-like 3
MGPVRKPKSKHMLQKHFWIIPAAIVGVIILWAAMPCKEEKKVEDIHPHPIEAQNSQGDCFLVISDMHLNDSSNQSSIGLLKRDGGHDVWKISLEKITELLNGKGGFPKPHFIICLGDLPYHAKKDNAASAMKNAGIVIKQLKSLADKAGIPILYVPGNNDSPFGDYEHFSLDSFKKSTGCNDCWPVAGVDPQMQSDSLLSTIGCYTARPLGNKSKLKVIALNSTAFVEKYTDKKDAASEIKWLSTQLEIAKHDGDNVILAMHVPPGANAFTSTDDKKNYFWDIAPLYNSMSIQDTFMILVDKYKDIISCLLTSHTHMAGISRLHDKQGAFTSILLSVPAIAPSVFNNPSMDIVMYNNKSFAIDNFSTLYTDLKDSTNGSLRHWTNGIFDFKKILGTSSLASLKNLIDTMNIGRLQKAVAEIYHPGTSNTTDALAAKTIDIEFVRKQ